MTNLQHINSVHEKIKELQSQIDSLNSEISIKVELPDLNVSTCFHPSSKTPEFSVYIFGKDSEYTHQVSVSIEGGCPILSDSRGFDDVQLALIKASFEDQLIYTASNIYLNLRLQDLTPIEIFQISKITHFQLEEYFEYNMFVFNSVIAQVKKIKADLK